MTTTQQPLKPPLAPAAGPKPQHKPPPRPPDAPKPKPAEPDVALYTRLLAQKRSIELTLHDGSVIKGSITAYGQYTIAIVEETGAEIVIFKNFIRAARASGS